MKRYLFLFLIILILALVQSSFSEIYFVLLFSLSFFILDNNEMAVKAVFIGGLVLDLLGTAVFGQFVVAATFVMVFLMLCKRLLGKTLLFYALFSVLAITVFNFMIHLPKLLASKTSVANILVNLVLLVLILPLASWLNELFKKNTVRRN